MLAYPPPTPHGQEEWLFANYQSHQSIIYGVNQLKKVILPLYQIYPVSPHDLTVWLDQHAQQHSDMNQILGLPSNDLTDVDLTDDNQRTAFYFLHLQEHRDALSVLGMGL